MILLAASGSAVARNPFWSGDWAAVRALWDLDPEVRHLNHGSYGAAPRPVLEAQASWIRAAQRNPNRFYRVELDAALQGVRERAGRFLKADPSGLYLLSNPTTAVLAALRSAGVGAGDRVLVTDRVYPGVAAGCAGAGAGVETWRLPEPAVDPVEDFAQALERSRPRLAILDHVAYASGHVLPVAALVAAARAAGVQVCVDGAHAPGAIDLDLGSIGADFYAGSFHKWCCAPPGAGFLHARGAVIPPVPGARELEGPPASIEWSGTHDFSPLLAVPAALDLLEGVGLERIRAYQRALTGQAASLLDVPRLPSSHPGLLGVRLGRVAEDRARALRDQAFAAGLEVAAAFDATGWTLRISAFLYNQPSDYEELAAWLRPRLPLQPARRSG